MGEPERVDRRRQRLAERLGALVVAQVPAATPDALLEERWIARGAQHPLAVIGLQHDDRRLADGVADDRGGSAEVGEERHLLPSSVDQEAKRLVGVVRHWNRRDLDRADPARLGSAQCDPVGASPDCPERTVAGQHRATLVAQR